MTINPRWIWYLNRTCALDTLYFAAMAVIASFSMSAVPLLSYKGISSRIYRTVMGTWPYIKFNPFTSVLFPRPNDMYDVTEIPWWWWWLINSNWLRNGWHSTWLLIGLITHFSMILSTWLMSKLETPKNRTSPNSTALNAFYNLFGTLTEQHHLIYHNSLYVVTAQQLHVNIYVLQVTGRQCVWAR